MNCIAAASTVLANRIPLITRVFAVLACSFAFSLTASGQIVNVSVFEQFRAHDQHFSCTVEYAPAKCVHDLQQLHRLLEKYNADGLGGWQMGRCLPLRMETVLRKAGGRFSVAGDDFFCRSPGIFRRSPF